MPRQYDGFWFPASVRDEILTPERTFETVHFQGGTIIPDSTEGSVTVRWPRLELVDWQRVLNILKKNRMNLPATDWSQRLPQAMTQLQALWTEPDNPLWRDVVESLEICTGHSAGMLNSALGLLQLISVEDLQTAASAQLTNAVRDTFFTMDGLPGQVKFYTHGLWSGLVERLLLHFDGYRHLRFSMVRQPANMMLGYAAGNVPGTGLLLTLLGLAAAAGAGDQPPVILIRNSRREPIFTSLVISALELIDPGLLETTMVTIWDHADASLQEYLIAQSDLVVAAASDETIEELGATIKRASTASHPIRFHEHGHKVSFSTIGREGLDTERMVPDSDVALVDAVAFLAALDSALWNQQGCLSSRVHFVEETGELGYHSAEAYGWAVVQSLRAIDEAMPKAITRRRQIHNLFDQYQAIAVNSSLQVLSEYDDNFLVLLDRRELSEQQFGELVNTCQGRTVAIVPVSNVMEVPRRYLRPIGRHHLQSMSVALGTLNTKDTDPRLLEYATALGTAGVTSIRTVGRGAFPQLAYSWDGLLPLDFFARRQRGHFTALEFDEPWQQIYQTYRLINQAIGVRIQGP
jgi:hypothetical protein